MEIGCFNTENIDPGWYISRFISCRLSVPGNVVWISNRPSKLFNATDCNGEEASIITLFLAGTGYTCS